MQERTGSREEDTRGERIFGAFRAGSHPLACLPRASPFFLATIYFLAPTQVRSNSSEDTLYHQWVLWIPNERNDRGIWGDCKVFHFISWFLVVENLTKYFLWGFGFIKEGFFSFCYLALIEALAGDFFFASIPSPIPVTSNPNGGTPPDSISKKSSKKICFCSYVKERNTFFYGRYVIEGDILERIKVCCLWEQRIPVQNIVGYRHPGISWWKI